MNDKRRYILPLPEELALTERDFCLCGGTYVRVGKWERECGLCGRREQDA